MTKVDVIAAVDTFLREHPQVDALEDQDELLTLGVQAANLVIALGRVSARVRGPETRGVPRRHAPALGLLVRSVKLYEGIVLLVCDNKTELAEALVRPLLESLATAEYLMRSKAPAASATEFISISYRAEVRMIKYLEAVKSKHKLLPIEQRMLRSARSHLRVARLSYRALAQRKNWNLDGKDMASILRAVGWHAGLGEEEKGYIFGFMAGSHWAHGTWFDLITNHLRFGGGRYRSRVDYKVPTAAHLIPASMMLLRGICALEARFRRRGSAELLSRAQAMIAFFQCLNGAVERHRSAGSSITARR